jgi:hypothetical protein
MANLFSPLPLYPGYFYDSFGNIFSNKGTGGRNNSLKSHPLKKKSLVIGNHGYLIVNIRNNPKEKAKVKLVHIIICQAEHANPFNKPTVNHLDGDKLNNRPGNLAWATYEEQMAHAIKMGLCNISGQNNPMSKTNKLKRRLCQ